MLGLKQTQRLSPVLTQQLQQAIKLLQLGQLELMEAIELEINENPVLEIAEEASAPEEGPQEKQEQGTEEKDDMAEWLERYSVSEEISSEYAGFEDREIPRLREYGERHHQSQGLSEVAGGPFRFYRGRAAHRRVDPGKYR